MLPELVTASIKHINRMTSSISIKLVALKLISASVLALGNDTRCALTVQADALKIAERHCKVIFKLMKNYDY